MPSRQQKKRSASQTGGTVVSSNGMKSAKAGSSAAESKSAAISAKNQKLLERQASLIKIIQTYGTTLSTTVPAAVVVEQPSNRKTATRDKRGSVSKANVQNLAQRLGIWNESGKLTPSYKKK